MPGSVIGDSITQISYSVIAAAMAFTFEKLEVYQKAVTFADEVASATENFPRGYYFLADPLNRAALSVATNMADGSSRFIKSDRKNLFTIALCSVHECVPLLEIAKRRGFLGEDTHARLMGELEAISNMIGGLVVGLESR